MNVAKKTIGSAIVTLFSMATIFAQSADSVQFKLLYEVPRAAERIELDRLGQLYVYAAAEWTKYTVAGRECCRYSAAALQGIRP